MRNRRWVGLVVFWCIFAASAHGAPAEPPALAPVATVRVSKGATLYFSMQGQGYPVARLDGQTIPGTGHSTTRMRMTLRRLHPATLAAGEPPWLQQTLDTGRGRILPLVSPHGTQAAWFQQFPREAKAVMPHMLRSDRPDRPVPLPKGTEDYNYRAVLDNGTLLYDNGLLLPDGRLAVLPPRSETDNTPCRPCRIVSTAPRYQVVSAWPGDLIYDLQERRIVARYTPAGTDKRQGVLFQSGDRFLVISFTGWAYVVDATGCLARFGVPNDTIWRWGEDGSAWTMYGGTLHILRWHDAVPTLAEIPGPLRADAWISDLARPEQPAVLDSHRFAWGHGPAWATVWHDGAGLARAAMEGNTRVLTLYRGDTVTGVYRVPLTAPTAKEIADADQRLNYSSVGPLGVYTKDAAMHAAIYREHLAFTADGKYLCWMLKDRTEQVTAYVFTTGM